MVVGVIGIALEHGSPSSDGFCVVKSVTHGGPVDISGYERSNGQVCRVQVGDWLLRVNGILCRDMPLDEIKRYIVGPVVTKVEVVFVQDTTPKESLCSSSGSEHPHNPMLHGPASNSIRLKCTLGIMMIRESSATARESETEQAAIQTETKTVETRPGAGRETDTTTVIETTRTF